MIHITLWQNEKRDYCLEVDVTLVMGRKDGILFVSAVSALTIAALNGLTEYVLLQQKLIEGWLCTLQFA